MKLLVAVFYAGAVAMAWLLLTATERADRQYDALVARDTPGEAASRTSKVLLEHLTFGLYRGAEEAREDRASLARALASSEHKVVAWSTALLGTTLISLAVGGWRWRRAEHPVRTRAQLGLHLCGCAVVFLVLGVLTPILTIVAHQEVAVLGRVVLSHETKSFVGTIAALVETGNWPVAALLALFSLIVPIAKLGLSAFALACQARERLEGFTARTHAVLHHLGKWSMTDVFVVAILVAYFAAGGSDATEARVGVGLYFFAAHTGLAVLATMLAPRGPPAGAGIPARVSRQIRPE